MKIIKVEAIPLIFPYEEAIYDASFIASHRQTVLVKVTTDNGLTGWGEAACLREGILEFQKDDRPVIVTEWLARDKRSTIEDCLPVMKELNAGAVNRGFVTGKSATIWNWDSRKTADGKRCSVVRERKEGNVIEPGERMPEPEIWFHDIFRFNGTPYNPVEIKNFKALTGGEIN